MIRLVLGDIDGTLKPFGQDTVSRRAIEAVHLLRDVGIRFGPATGREIVDLRAFFQGDGACFATGILSNGKAVYVDGERVFVRPLDANALDRLERYCFERPELALMAFVPDAGARSDADTHPQVSGAPIDVFREYVARTGMSFATSITFGPLPKAPILTAGINYIGTDQPDMDELSRTLSNVCPEFDFVSSAPLFFDVLPHGWTKEQALGILLDNLGLGTDEVAFFGDADNDVAMFRAIPNSYVVANGTPLALATARHHIGDAREDSVAREMERIAQRGGA